MKVAVYCGSSMGNDDAYAAAAKALGKYFAEQSVTLVYGGGKVGLMGVVADAVLDNGGKVIGVIPTHLKHKEIGHPGLTELIEVADMHARKAKMAELADAYVALPGGAGTMDEFFEIWTWAQLGHHQKPCALYNVNGFYDGLLSFIHNAKDAGFTREAYAEMIIVATEPQQLMTAYSCYESPAGKWH